MDISGLTELTGLVIISDKTIKRLSFNRNTDLNRPIHPVGILSPHLAFLSEKRHVTTCAVFSWTD